MLRFVIVLYVIIGTSALLHAMDHEQAIAELLVAYPAPSYKTGWVAGLFCGDFKRKVVHEQVLQEARAAEDTLKVSVLDHVYEGYFQIPQWLWCGPYARYRTFSEKSILRSAIQAGRVDLVGLLLAHGAPPNTCVYSASIALHCYGVQTPLMSFVEAFPEDGDNQAAFEHICSLLIAQGAGINEQHHCCRQHGISFPLKEALKKEKLHLAKLLIRCGADIDLLDSSLKTLLCCVAEWNNVKLVESLLSLGADANMGHSALPCAYRQGRQKMISVFLEHGAHLSGKDEYGQTVFHTAIERGDHNGISMFLTNAHFTRTKAEMRAAKKRILTALCALRKLGVSKDIRTLLVEYLPEEVTSLHHCKWLLQKGVALESVVPHCQFGWLTTVYQETDDNQKLSFLERLVPLIVAHRLLGVRTLLESKWLKDLYQDSVIVARHVSPQVIALLDPNNVAQHQAAINATVTNAILGVDDMPLEFDIE